MLIPGPLQTDGYNAAVVNGWLDAPDDDLTEERNRLRRQRQERLEPNHDRPLHLHAIIHENALRFPMGGPDAPCVMGPQLDAILARAQQPNVTIQVIPADLGAYHGIASSYRLLKFGDDNASAVYVENLNDGLYIEDDQEIAAYTLNFEHLQDPKVALAPQASIRLITEIREGWA